MKKKKKINKKKFLSRIIFLFIIIALIVTVIKNLGKKEEAKWEITVILNGGNVTESFRRYTKIA